MITRITFKDEGQDFLTWDINSDGQIIACKPFQFSIWKQWNVMNKRFTVGRLIHLRKADATMTVKYPIEKVEKIDDSIDLDILNCKVRSFFIDTYFNIKERRESYGVVIDFGRKKTQKKRLPLIFLKEKVCSDFYDELQPLIGLTEPELQKSELLDSLIDKYKVLALNYKPKTDDQRTTRKASQSI